MSGAFAPAAPPRPTGAPLQVIAPRPRKQFPKLFSLAVAVLFMLAAVLVQWRNGAYRGEFGGYQDEAAHYITGLMVHDYITSGHLATPKAYATNYYLHYPKVGIGHWPPFFYMVQAAWMLIFPISRASLLILMALLTAVAAFTLYRAVAAELGWIAGLASGLFLISLPAIQWSTSMVMADILVGLLGLLAALSFARFLESEKSGDAAWFGLFAVMMILTKGTGLALAGVPPLALLLTNRWRLMLKRAFWLPVLIVVSLSGPWYWFTRSMIRSTENHPETAFHFVKHAIRFYFLQSVHMLGIVLFALAVIGFIVQIVLPRRKDVSPTWAALAALLFSTALMICVVPAFSLGGIEDRFLLPALPALVAFSLAGLHYLARKLFAAKMSLNFRVATLIVLVSATLIPRAFSKPAPLSYGFAPVSQYLLSQPDLKKSVIMISSDAFGEGMFIAETAMREKRPGHYLVRATKVLCDCSWTGEEHSPLYPNPAAMIAFFDRSPIQILVYDESVPPSPVFNFHRMLGQTIRAYPSQWTELRAFPITRNGVLYPSAIKVYKLAGADPKASMEINVRRMLHQNIELTPQ